MIHMKNTYRDCVRCFTQIHIRPNAINFHFASFHFLAVYFAGIVLFHIRLVTTASPLILSLRWCCARSFPHRSAPHPLVCDRVVARFTCRRNKTKVSFSLPLINLCECMLLPFVYYLDALQCLSWQFFFWACARSHKRTFFIAHS